MFIQEIQISVPLFGNLPIYLIAVDKFINACFFQGLRVGMHRLRKVHNDLLQDNWGHLF